jgi:cysteine/O-acetylserine efflux protein
MPLSVLIEMTISAILTVWSPGPNNILLLSTASKYGVSGNLHFMTGIWSGSLTLMCLSGLFCSTLGTVIPGIQPVMKYLGAAYILYLAWQTWKRCPPSDQVQEKKPTWLMGFFLQLVNVKIIIYGLTMFSAYILPYESRSYMLFFFAVYLMVLGALGNLIWAFAGNVLKRFYTSCYKLMNAVMALLLVWCSLRIIGVL